jgi:hypothetical protein
VQLRVRVINAVARVHRFARDMCIVFGSNGLHVDFERLVRGSVIPLTVVVLSRNYYINIEHRRDAVSRVVWRTVSEHYPLSLT